MAQYSKSFIGYPNVQVRRTPETAGVGGAEGTEAEADSVQTTIRTFMFSPDSDLDAIVFFHQLVQLDRLLREVKRSQRLGPDIPSW